MKKTAHLLLCWTLILSLGCAGKAAPMNSESIRTIQKLRVGVVELSSHDFDTASLYSCIKNYPSSSISLDGPTQSELSASDWNKGRWIYSLKSQDFQTYEDIKNFSLLMLLFKNKEQKNYVRLINFLSKQVQTIPLEPNQFSCENILSAAKLLVIDSHPPYADVFINGRKIGEAPVWTSIADGTYDVQCKLPDDVFPKRAIKVPSTVQFLCQRENSQTSGIEDDDKTTVSEKSQSLFLYALMGAVSVSGIIIPFLIFK